MTTATPAAPAKAAAPEKKDDKKPEAKKDGLTGKLPLKGGKDGVTKTLDNKDVLKAPADPKVVKAAEVLAGILDRKAKIVAEEEDASVALLDAFDKTKKARKVRVVGETRAYFFSKATLSRLVVEKKKANEA